MTIPDPATTEWVPIWNPTSQGPVGPAGPAGPPGDATPYRDLVEGTYANPAADVARVYALDVNGYTQVEMKDSAGRGVRFSSDNVIIAKITEPAGVARGQAVYIAGAAGANSLVRLAKADSIATMPVIGIVLDAGAVNAFTRILSVGTLQGVDTSAFVEGVSLFVSPTVAGGFTATLPVAPNYAQRVGFVTRSHATQGEILVLTTGVLADPRLHHTTHETGGSDEVLFPSGVKERGRTVPMGEWQDAPFNAANFTATGGGTWTVAASAVFRNRYTLIGKVMHWSLYLSWFSGTNVVAGTVSALNITIPGGLTSTSQIYMPVALAIDGGRTEFDANPGGAQMTFSRKAGGNFTAGSPGIVTNLVFEVF